MENVANKNGVNVEQLVETIETIKKDPEVANFQFRGKTEWIGGGHSQTTFQHFYGAKQEDHSRDVPIVMESDEPAVLLGENQGTNAVEAVLHALGSCLSVGFVYNAAASDIEVKSVSFDIEGDLDLQAFLGISKKSRPGYQHIKVTCRADADAPREKIEELFNYVQKTSPVLDIIRNPVKVDLKLV